MTRNEGDLKRGRPENECGLPMSDAPHLADAVWLRSPALVRVLAMLNRDGEEARVVGGAARNALMGLPLNDIDIATTALPDEVVRRAAAAGVRAVPTGIDHGTVTLVADGMPFEVTTLRQDVETFGRKAKVAFGRDWKADAERRDFTMNALSITADGVIHDYVGGLADLEARRIRFIGEPARRIAEDYLRILRFFRFQASYALGAPDPAGLHASIVARDGLRSLSRERVRAELMKLFIAPFAVPTVTVMAEAGFMTMLLGGVALTESFAAMARVEAAAGLMPDPVRRLGALGVLIAEDAGRLRERLRLFNAEHDRLFAMADGWWRLVPALDEAGLQSLLYRIGPERYLDRALIAWTRAPHSISDPAWRDLAGLPSRWTAPRFPLKAADFIARGVQKGPALGTAMRAAEDAWVAAGFPAGEAALARIADEAADAARPPPEE
jgi:tRNA nucleotidyltransferase/poly(A) polymerase